jgi:excisionase family DNA binding protein
MTVDEVAEYLKLSKITVYKLTQKGEIPGFRIGSSWRYNRDKIDEIARVGTKQNT